MWPNLRLQRTAALASPRASAGEAHSFGTGMNLLAKFSVVVGLGCLIGCSAAPVPAGPMLQRAESCRGWITSEIPARTVGRVAGVTRNRDDDYALPNVDVILAEKARGRALFMVRSSKAGRFDFGRIPQVCIG